MQNNQFSNNNQNDIFKKKKSNKNDEFIEEDWEDE